jgi:hypothetical protein
MPLVPLQQADPMRYKAWVEAAQQPAAQLQETQAAAGAAGASAANSESEIKAREQELAQHQFLQDTQKLFTAKKDKGGYVDPDLFNKTKQLATHIGIGGDAFDSVFAKAGYVNPTKIINYNTAEGMANQQAYNEIKRQIQAQIDKYNSIPGAQKGLFSTAQIEKIPFLGQLLAPDAVSYEKSREGLSAQLKGIAGAGAGSGVRVSNTELERWANLIPSATDAPTVAHKNIQTIDSQLKATFNTPQGLDSHYLPSNGRAPLASFGG